jgi:hypothetical protein
MAITKAESTLQFLHLPAADYAASLANALCYMVSAPLSGNEVRSVTRHLTTQLLFCASMTARPIIRSHAFAVLRYHDVLDALMCSPLWALKKAKFLCKFTGSVASANGLQSQHDHMLMST